MRGGKRKTFIDGTSNWSIAAIEQPRKVLADAWTEGHVEVGGILRGSDQRRRRRALDLRTAGLVGVVFDDCNSAQIQLRLHKLAERAKDLLRPAGTLQSLGEVQEMIDAASPGGQRVDQLPRLVAFPPIKTNQDNGGGQAARPTAGAAAVTPSQRIRVAS